MARIYGTIESLKSLKSDLDTNGISRFNSVKEIKNFLSNYDAKKRSILDNESQKLDREYIQTCSDLKRRQHEKAEIITSESEKIDSRIYALQTKIDAINNTSNNVIKKLISSLKLYSLKKKLNYYVVNKTKLIKSSVKHISRTIENDQVFIRLYETGKQALIENRAKSKTAKLESTRTILEGCRNLISGAIGEHLVVKEIEKLSDDFVLINDFNLEFTSPDFL